jgi:hypothetical protein
MLDKSIIWYVCGPMTGYKGFNYPMFRAAARHLREEGYQVVSPAEMDSELMQQLAENSPDGDAATLCAGAGETWGDVLARDVKVIADELGGIVVLPDWHKSRGARLEVFVGLLTGKVFGEFYFNHNQDPVVNALHRSQLQRLIKDNMP